MPRDGSGTFTLASGNPVVPNTIIETNWANPTLSDIAAALTDSVSASGQTTPNANLPMGGYRHTGVSDPTSRNQYATLGMMQDGRHQRAVISSGVNALVGSLVGGATSYSAGQLITFAPVADNTGPCTLSLNGIAPVSLISPLGNALGPGDLRLGNLYMAAYTGSAWRILFDLSVTGGAFRLQASVTGQDRPSSGTYPLLAVASVNSVSVPAGSGFVVPPGAQGSDLLIPVSWSAQTIVIAGITSSFSTTLAVNAAGAVNQFTGRPNASALRNHIILGYVEHVNGQVTSVHTAPALYGDDGYRMADLGILLQNQIVSGCIVSRNGAQPLQMDNAGGLVLSPGASPNAVSEPNYLTIPPATPISFRTLAGTSTLSAATSTAPVGNYDVGGVVTPIPGAGATTSVHRLYYIYGTYLWVYGQRTYPDFNTAMALLEQDRALYVPSNKLLDAVLLAEIVATKGTTDLAAPTTCAILNRGNVFYGVGVPGGISDAPSNGNTYGRRNGAWATTIAASAPNLTGDVVVTKTNPKIILNDSPTGVAEDTLTIQQAGVDWFSIGADVSDDKAYIRSFTPGSGLLRHTTVFDMVTGQWTFPDEVFATSPSLTDVTPGRLLPVGAFGLGAGSITPTADLNSLTAAGTYFADVGALNTPSASTAWVVQHYAAGASNAAAQFIIQMTDGATFVRTKNGGVWSAWSAAGGSGGGGTMQIQTFTASGTWVRPAGVNAISVLLVGGGQGGGGVKTSTNDDVAAGGGGGGGQVIRRTLAVTADVTVTVGAGGAGGVGSGIGGAQGWVAGSNGGDSSLAGGAVLVAKGGGTTGNGGGLGMSTTTGPAGGSGGGGGSSGDTRAVSVLGSTVFDTTAANYGINPGRTAGTGANTVSSSVGGRGVDGYGGGGCGGMCLSSVPTAVKGVDGGGTGASYTANTSTAGGNGTANTGGGGGGASSEGNGAIASANGGTGGSGLCVITWFE